MIQRDKFMLFFGSLIFLQLSFSSGYIQLSTLKSKMFHKILVNQKIKNDFRKITSNDAYKIASFWHDELTETNNEMYNNQNRIDLLYNPTKSVFETSVNLTDFKYNIINDADNINEYYIWRPKIQICLPFLHSVDETIVNQDCKNEGIKKTLLYPSFCETMFLLLLESPDRYRNKCATLSNIARSPYWNEPKYDSLELLNYSLKKYFVNYLKYPRLHIK